MIFSLYFKNKHANIQRTIKMNLLRYLILLFSLLVSPVHAIGPPLSVGIESYSPPFVIQGANHEIYGFDIDMMTALCKIMQRTCNFRVMRFEQLIDAVANKEIDTAVSSITITEARSKKVNFSMPYLLSYSRFLTNHNAEAHKIFSLDMLKDKKIGIGAGTVFADQINDMGIKSPIIKEYSSIAELLEALRNNDVDFILLDNPNALYWEANSSGAFMVVGDPYMYGNGIGIAVNRSERALLDSINQALLQYQSSPEYKKDYNRYLMQF